MPLAKLKSRCPHCNASLPAKRSFDYSTSFLQCKCYRCGFHETAYLNEFSGDDTLVLDNSETSGELDDRQP